MKFFGLLARSFLRERKKLPVFKVLQIAGLLGDAYQRGRHGHAPIKDSSRFLSWSSWSLSYWCSELSWLFRFSITSLSFVIFHLSRLCHCILYTLDVIWFIGSIWSIGKRLTAKLDWSQDWSSVSFLIRHSLSSEQMAIFSADFKVKKTSSQAFN